MSPILLAKPIRSFPVLVPKHMLFYSSTYDVL